MNRTNKFEEGLNELRQVSLAPEEKQAIFHTVSRYVETHPAAPEEGFYVALARVFRTVFTTISWK